MKDFDGGCTAAKRMPVVCSRSSFLSHRLHIIGAIVLLAGPMALCVFSLDPSNELGTLEVEGGRMKAVGGRLEDEQSI